MNKNGWRRLSTHPWYAQIVVDQERAWNSIDKNSLVYFIQNSEVYIINPKMASQAVKCITIL